MFAVLIYIMHVVGYAIAGFVSWMFIRGARHAGYDKEYFWDHTDKDSKGQAKLKYRVIYEGEPEKVYKNGCKMAPDGYPCYWVPN